MRLRYHLLLLLLPFTCIGQGVDSTAFANLTNSLQQLQNSELMKHGSLGVSLSVTQSGESLVSFNGDKSIPPASTLKLVTTATAMEVLGEGFSFETYLEYEGTITDGTLKGDLFIRGMGDPTLGSPRFKDKTDSATVFNAWITALRNSGIRRIEGNVCADASYFDELAIEDSWMWGDVANGYGAGVYGLNWNENVTRLYFKSNAKVGEAATFVRTEPAITDVHYVNRVTIGPVGSGDKTLIRPASTLTQMIVDGTIPKTRGEYSIRGAVFNPPLLLVNQFSSFLNAQNLPVTQAPAVCQPGSERKDRKQIFTWKSPPLSEICKQTNWWSINLYADALVKAIGKKLIGKTDFKQVAPAIVSFWALKGVPVGGMVLRDGSGLAGTALMTPQNLVNVLNAASRMPRFSTFLETIPIAGEAGTVRSRRFGNKGTVRAKSGSIEGTRAYAGYINSRSGQRLSFVINAHRYHPDSSTKTAQQLIDLVRLMGEL
jgi:D-alanyl-D-alanine carboxypeptidase/D-alanyl-D-alanine-endopeptidase (penicillin-binding protein 4)